MCKISMSCLDVRWDIKIQPQTPPGKKSSKSQLKRTASKIQGRKEEPEKVPHSSHACSLIF